jgi:transposase
MSTSSLLKQSIGIDVSKDKIAVCFAVNQTEKKFRILATRNFDNNANGFAQLHGWIKKHRKPDLPVYALMEATGVYYESLAYFLREINLQVLVVLPNKTSAFAKSLNYKSKTDGIDAKILAQMALEREMPEWTPAGKNMLKMKRLCRERVELLVDQTSVKNRLHAKKHSYKGEVHSMKRAAKMLEFLKKQITEVEQEITKLISSDPEIKAKVDNICTIKGIGIITAATIIAETNGFALIKNKAQLVSYAGYDVVENQSGTSINGKTKISKKGNSFIRRALHFPALTTIKYNPSMKELYDRVFEKNRIKMKAAVAVQRKLLVLVYTLYRKDECFDPQGLTTNKNNLPNKNRQELQCVPA